MEKPLPAIGWREWLALPDLGVDWIKAKVDTGARSSALHVADLEVSSDGAGHRWVSFGIFPRQRSKRGSITARVPLLGTRAVRSSSGNVEERPLIATTVIVGEVRLELEMTLTNRDDMGFRILLGRQAVRRRFIVNPARSYLGPKPPRKVIAQNWRSSSKKAASK